jgi:hypothetical protein
MATDDYPANPQTGGTLPSGGTVHGTLEAAGDVDWFRVDLDTDHAYRFTAAMADGSEPAIILWNETAHYVYYSNQPGMQYSDELVNPFAVYVPGSYYVQVSAAKTGATTGAYTIGMQVAADDIGNSEASALALAPGTPLAARFDYAFDRDPFRIAAVAGTSYTVTLASDSGKIGNAVYVYLAGADGRSVTTYSGAPISYTFTADATRDYVVTATMASFDPPTGGSLPYHVSLTVNGDLRLAAVASSATADGAIRVTYDGKPHLGYGLIELVDAQGHVVDTWTPSDARFSLQGNMLTLSTHAGAVAPGTYTLKYGSHVLTDSAGAGLRPSSFDTVTVTKGTATPAPAPNPTPTPSPGTGTGDSGTVSVGTGSADVALYAGTAADYTIVRAGATTIVTKFGALNSDTLIGYERLKFTGSADVVALSLDGDLGRAYRLYTAAFDRAPDKAGLGFWLHSAESGTGLSAMAHGFIDSAEFRSLYGASPAADAFVAALYHNVLHRPGDAAGVAYWEDRLGHGADRADVLAAFSESPENQEQAAALIGNGILYTSYG